MVPGTLSNQQRPRVLIVDDNTTMLAHVAHVLQNDFVVAGIAIDADMLVTAWQSARPDVLVLDVSLRRGSGFDAMARVRSSGCDAPVVFLSVHEAPEIVQAAWSAGGSAYVAKRNLTHELIPAIRAVLRGERYVSTAIGRC